MPQIAERLSLAHQWLECTQTSWGKQAATLESLKEETTMGLYIITPITLLQSPLVKIQVAKKWLEEWLGI